jgi:hypothetical protein
MIDELSKGWDDTEEDELMPDLLAWAGSVQLTEQEAASIRNSILENVTGYRRGWSERMSVQIDRTIAHSQRRMNQTLALRLQLQTNRIERRLSTQSLLLRIFWSLLAAGSSSGHYSANGYRSTSSVISA